MEHRAMREIWKPACVGTKTCMGSARGRREERGTNDRAQHIRESAEYVWEQEGCPEDQAERHWSAAVAVVEAQDVEGENREGRRGTAFKEASHCAPLEAA